MTLVKYLSERVSQVDVNSDKIYNEGCRLLANYETWNEELQDIIDEAWDVLVKFCVRNRNTNYNTAVKLTFASSTIGTRLAKRIDVEPTPKTILALGDILLETFLQGKLIEIRREYEGYMAPYVVCLISLPKKIRPKLLGTFFEPLKPIKSLFSAYTGESYIKGWSDNKAFKKIVPGTHIQALDKARQTGWELNKVVLEALRKNEPSGLFPLATRDGVIFNYPLTKNLKRVPKHLFHMDGSPFLGKRDPKLQKAISKYFEYQQILQKANLIEEHGGKFWQEMTLDYRGRMYYSESFMEYQGSDMARSLFLFQERQPVTDRGREWLYTYAASCYNKSYNITELDSLTWTTEDYKSYLQQEGLETISLDKMTVKDRINWSKHHLDFLLKVGQERLVLKEAEKPYALLSVCNEIVNDHLLKAYGKVYYSNLPVPVDGSNNGWQHLAAISKDEQAGELVSLVPTAIQKDFYVAVAKKLITLQPDWFAERSMPMKHIRKGIAKRGSMTRAYSAGKQRIAKNMYDDCHVEGFTNQYNIDESDTNLLAGSLIDAINIVCNGPLRTTKFLQKLAEESLNNNNVDLRWTSPSGFPVIYKANLQREHKQRGTIKGITGSKDGRVMHVIRADVMAKDGSGKVPCRKSFASGISPNYIHSLDAAHMANVIVNFPGSFAAVHDSYATHCGRVDELQKVTKQEFVKMYDVENFFNHIEESMGVAHGTVQQPQLGSLNVKKVIDSEYFFTC